MMTIDYDYKLFHEFLGCTLALRKKFSASQAIADCCKYNATVLQYIGEIMRYIVAQSNVS